MSQARYDPCPECGAALATNGVCYQCGWDPADVLEPEFVPWQAVGCAVLLAAMVVAAAILWFAFAPPVR